MRTCMLLRHTRLPTHYLVYTTVENRRFRLKVTSEWIPTSNEGGTHCEVVRVLLAGSRGARRVLGQEVPRVSLQLAARLGHHGVARLVVLPQRRLLEVGVVVHAAALQLWEERMWGDWRGRGNVLLWCCPHFNLVIEPRLWLCAA